MGREEHVPESSDYARYWLKLCSSSCPSGKLWREPDVKWFDLTFVPVSKNMQRFALQYRKEPHVLKSAGNSIEQQKTLKIEWKVKGFCWQTSWKIRGYRFRLSQEIWKLNDTKHSRSNHAEDHDWVSCGNRKPSIVFNAQRVMTGNILLVSSSWPSLIFSRACLHVFLVAKRVTLGMKTGGWFFQTGNYEK